MKKNMDEITKWYVKNRPVFEKLAGKLESIIREVLDSADVSYYTVTSRAKEIDSFISKASDNKYKDPIKEIKDLAGVRVITFVKSEIDICSEIIQPLFDIDPEHSTDKSKELGDDKVGYRSLHYVAKLTDERLNLPEYKIFKDLQFEIQIRTILEHAWADISHTKNYKFNGVLPPDNDIKRRFALAAATLELVDREFNSISQEISEYQKEVKDKTSRDELDIDINSTSLSNFLSLKFKDFIEDYQLESHFNQGDARIIEELNAYGITRLSELNALITRKLEVYLHFSTNFIGLLRHIMIINDAEKYFKQAWNKNWTGIEEEYLDYLKSIDVSDIENILKKYGVKIFTDTDFFEDEDIEFELEDFEEDEPA
ncbi:ppGpp synthetase catalytic domain-containing protein (RelA/SpoT-type nucleotidyltranferase) [Paenibacillus catalpae]|uniref:PpGpp synthetase catalytic domain-containing protein (RelA/SpoT-type nucleotidyltranferase) n=1 Tax=Paenibacillus catalpae TaxID=1045775 RepID=A0A1I2DGJ3_9BACL|nr:hypothetical protein [Paenibacillus catalpae]SFE79597.1 ppGpp synthetase catalytic domain-containing protein (RelA/SpoT-type nucleotidyltranferase) [Paenibacillus catalpae]